MEKSFEGSSYKLFFGLRTKPGAEGKTGLIVPPLVNETLAKAAAEIGGGAPLQWIAPDTWRKIHNDNAKFVHFNYEVYTVLLVETEMLQDQLKAGYGYNPSTDRTHAMLHVYQAGLPQKWRRVSHIVIEENEKKWIHLLTGLYDRESKNSHIDVCLPPLISTLFLGTFPATNKRINYPIQVGLGRPGTERLVMFISKNALNTILGQFDIDEDGIVAGIGRLHNDDSMCMM